VLTSFPTDDLEWSVLASTYGTPDAERILPTFEQYTGLAYMGNSVLFAVIGRRLNLFSDATFKFRSLSDKHLFGSPELAKLETPWPNGSTGELLARMEQDVSLAGNAYIRDAGDRLERLRPDWVTIVSHVTSDPLGRKVREVLGYWYQPVGDPERGDEYYTVDEVAHWSPIPDPLANFRGMSWMTPVIREINADFAMTAHRDAFFRNAATPNTVIRYTNRLKPETLDRIRASVAARHAGSENAFGTMILDEGADLTVVGDRMQGSAFVEIQAVGETRIANAAGVPGIVVGLREGRQTGAPGEYADAMRGFADATMRPNWRTACAALAKLVKVSAGAQLWYDTTDISALRQGEKDQADTMSTQASTANTLMMAGYEPDTIMPAIYAGDLTLLKHTGNMSVQMQPADGSPPPGTPGAPGKPKGAPRPASGAGGSLGALSTLGGGSRADSADVPTGAMVALVPTEADAQRLAVPDGELAEDLHVTLLFLGEASSLDAADETAVIDAVRQAAADMDAFTADGFSVSLFNPTAADKSPCIVLGLSGDDLGEAHDDIEHAVTGALESTGNLLIPQKKPWHAHLTLVYSDDDSLVGTLKDRTGPVTFDRIRCAFGGRITDIPLGG
jgi:phage portal protein BeeE/2'-5' RNA ligase